MFVPATMTLHIRRAVTRPNRNHPEVKDTKTESSHRTIGLSALALPYLQQMKAAGHTTSAMTLKYCAKGRETSSEAVAAVDRLYSA